MILHTTTAIDRAETFITLPKGFCKDAFLTSDGWLTNGEWGIDSNRLKPQLREAVRSGFGDAKRTQPLADRSATMSAVVDPGKLGDVYRVTSVVLDYGARYGRVLIPEEVSFAAGVAMPIVLDDAFCTRFLLEPGDPVHSDLSAKGLAAVISPKNQLVVMPLRPDRDWTTERVHALRELSGIDEAIDAEVRS